MSSMNKVILMGRLGKDPELRYTQNQTPVVTISLATSEYSEKNGQKQEFTEWHRIVSFGKAAENAAKYLAKGRQVLVEGKIQTKKWQDKDGKERYTTEILANNLTYIGGQGQGQDGGQAQAQQAPQSGPAYPDVPPMSSDEIPF